MKKAVSISMFFVLILVFSKTIIAQQKPQAIIQGSELIVPFSTAPVDSTMVIKFEKEEFMKVERIVCVNKDFKVISFSYYFTLEGWGKALKSLDNSFTPEMKNSISNIKPGNMFWIEHIKCKGIDGKEVELQTIPIKIKK